MKEEEAKKTFCPYIHKNCITTECMAWRKERDFSYANMMLYGRRREYYPDRGYCKLLKGN